MTHAHADPGMSLSAPRAAVTPAGAGGIQPTLLPAAPGAALRAQGLVSAGEAPGCGGEPQAVPRNGDAQLLGRAGVSRGAPVPILAAGTHTNPAGAVAAGSGAGEGPRSPRSRFRVGSTRWTRMSNHRARAVPARGHTRTSVSAARSEGHGVLGAGSSSPRSPHSALPGDAGTSPSAQPRRQGTQGPPAALPPGGAARGARPGAARGTLGQSRAEAGTSGPSLCPLSAGSICPSGTLGGAGWISSQKLLWAEVVFFTNDNYCNYLIAGWHPEATDN